MKKHFGAFLAFEGSKPLKNATWLRVGKKVICVAFLHYYLNVQSFSHNIFLNRCSLFHISIVFIFRVFFMIVFNLPTVSNGKVLKIKITALNLPEEMPRGD